jgi:hypothetical protein
MTRVARIVALIDIGEGVVTDDRPELEIARRLGLDWAQPIKERMRAWCNQQGRPRQQQTRSVVIDVRVAAGLRRTRGRPNHTPKLRTRKYRTVTSLRGRARGVRPRAGR